MKLKIYKIFCTKTIYPTCEAIAFTKEQAETYCKNATKTYWKYYDDWNGKYEEVYYFREEEIDTNKVFTTK